jgi:voltage-gated sodium channel
MAALLARSVERLRFLRGRHRPVPATGQFAVLRALRVLRVLRLLTMVPSMRRVVGALLAAIPGLGSIALVLLIIYYVFAVIATNLFATAFPSGSARLAARSTRCSRS